jgi:hypothetical protein
VLRQLRPYLLRRAGLIDFYHRNLLTAVRECYLPSEEQRRAGHSRLAAYFDSSDQGARKVDELPWQLAQVRSWGNCSQGAHIQFREITQSRISRENALFYGFAVRRRNGERPFLLSIGISSLGNPVFCSVSRV